MLYLIIRVVSYTWRGIENSLKCSILSHGGGTHPRLQTQRRNNPGVFTVIHTKSDSTITVSRSTDGGNSFSALGTVAQSTEDIDNPFIIQSLVCTMRNHSILPNGTFTFYRITASKSTDGGWTWCHFYRKSYREHLKLISSSRHSSSSQSRFHCLGTLWPYRTQSFQVYFASENNKTDQDIPMSSSTYVG